jgi:hypothetical protein
MVTATQLLQPVPRTDGAHQEDSDVPGARPEL